MKTKRVNFNMAEECHALLKSMCALKGVTVSEYCYALIAEDFKKFVYTDERIRDLFLKGNYPVGSKAYNLQLRVQEHFQL